LPLCTRGDTTEAGTKGFGELSIKF